MADGGPEPVSYIPGLRLRAIRFIDENALEFDFEGIDAPDEAFVLTRRSDNGAGTSAASEDTLLAVAFGPISVARVRQISPARGG